MKTDACSWWYTVEAGSAQLFGLGEHLEVGTLVGMSGPDGEPVRVEQAGQVVAVQYDMWLDRVIVALAPSDPGRERRRV